LQRFGSVQGGQGAVLLARLNYAALLLQRGQLEHGRALLQEIAGQHGAEPAVAALRDRANLLLGYHFLQQQAYQEAGLFLRRVRLMGPYSRAAMLALGWVELELRGAEYAMAPWIELLSSGVEDSLAEEAGLAIAAAIASKGASERAVEHYQKLLREYAAGRDGLMVELQRHTAPYAPEEIAGVLQGDLAAYRSVAGVTLSRLLDLRRQLAMADADAGEVEDDAVGEAEFFDRLWPQLSALYPQPDGQSGIGVTAYVTRRIEALIRSSLQYSRRTPRGGADYAARINADRVELEAEVVRTAEWYRQTRLAGLQGRDQRLLAYMERARLAIARNHELALLRQERE